ncbi:MAG TPA: sensor histidine kinase [Roseiarcus sp.]|jgi:two-component sensor histidine kinase
MRLLAPFGSVKTRLLALMAFVIVPVAVLTVALGAATDESFTNDLDRAWRQSTDDYVVRTRVWLRGATRTLDAAATAAGERGGDCSQMLSDMAGVIEGYQALDVRFDDGRTCAGGRSPDLANAAGKALAAFSDKPRVVFSQGQRIALGVFVAGGERLLALQVEAAPSSEQKWTALALVDGKLLDQLFEPKPGPNDGVALMERGGKVIVADGLDPADESWLPQTETVSEAYASAQAPSRSGSTLSYATQPVLGPQYYILRRFDTSARSAAWFRFLVLSVAPLATLAALYVVYSWAIQSEVLRWIEGIKLAILARRRGQSAKAFAPMDVGMPAELRDFAATFNEMARESSIREDSLKRSAAENEFLLRELHHRVKNSLQIIQSYLSLSRRLDGASNDSEAITAMEARVQVLAVAYRKAFSQGRMRDLRVRLFAEELTRHLSQSFRRTGLTLELEAEITTALMIDRAIPMGLALVESVMAGMRAEGARRVLILIVERERRQLELCVSTDGELAKNKPDDRLMMGLAVQLGATIEHRDPGVIIHWRFQGGPPPILPALDKTTWREDGMVEASRAPGAG